MTDASSSSSDAATGPTTGPVAVVTELKDMLGDLLDVLLEVKQAHRKVPEHDQLHRRLDILVADAQAWVGLLAGRAVELGGSLLGGVTSVAGRAPGNLFPGGSPDRQEVARVLVGHLEPVVAHARLHQSRVGEVDAASSQLLSDIADGLAAHQWAFSAVDDERAPQ